MSYNNPFEPENIGQAIDVLPNKYSRMGQMGLFDRRPIATTTVTIVRRGNKLVLLNPTARSGPRQELNRDLKNSVTFDIPSFKNGDLLTPEDIQNVTAFAPGPKQLEQVATAEARRLQKVRDPYDQTFEFFRLAAIKGMIVDPLGNVMYNLFDAFAIQKKVVYFDLDNPDTNVTDHTQAITDHIAENLGGETSDGGVHVICGGEFRRKLNSHPSRTKWLEQHPDAASLLAKSRDIGDPNAMRTTYVDGVTFESYTGKFTNTEGETLTPIENNRGYAFPTGTTEMFPEYDAPANRMGHVNTAPNEEIFVSTEVLKHDKGIDIDAEANKLPLCTQPRLLIECRAEAPG